METQTDVGGTTTEFVTSCVAGLAAVYTAMASAKAEVQIAALACLTAVVCTYIWSRTKVKVQ